MKKWAPSTAVRYAILIGVCVFLLGMAPDLLLTGILRLAVLHFTLAGVVGLLAYTLIRRAMDARSLLREYREQSRLLETIFQADPDGMAVLTGQDLRFRLVNNAYRTLAPNPALELLDRRYDDIWQDAGAPERMAIIRSVLETEVPADQPSEERVYPDKSVRYLDFRARPLSWAGGQAVLLVVRDNTAAELGQRREDAATREAQRRADELDAIFDAMVEGVIVYDANGSAIRANPTAEDILGASAETATVLDVAQRLSIRYPDGEPVAADQMPSGRALLREIVRSERLVLTSARGDEIAVIASATPLFVDGQVTGAVAVFHDVTELELAHQRAGQLAALEERQRLARELHDSVSQALYGIALGANSALASMPDDTRRTREALEYVVSLASMALTEMRALIFDLRPESLKMEGLVAGLGRQAAALRARYEVDLQAEFCAEPDASLPVKEALYRIAREALLNAVKHANASQIRLRLEECAAGLQVSVSDDGQGFDPSASFPGHLGLRSMLERASDQGGVLRIDSAPGQGTCVSASIPYPRKA